MVKNCSTTFDWKLRQVLAATTLLHRQLLRLAGFSIVTTGAEGVTTGSEVVTVARVNK